MSEATQCITCLKSKANLVCGICQSSVCKKCAQFVEEESLSFLKEVPEDLSHSAYCTYCFDAKVAPELRAYQEAIDQAREVFVFYKNQGKETRLLKRNHEPLHVKACADRNETLLRLAFLAVKSNCNTLVDVTITAEKIRNGGYQTTSYEGFGVPVQVDPKSQILRNPE